MEARFAAIPAAGRIEDFVRIASERREKPVALGVTLIQGHMLLWGFSLCFAFYFWVCILLFLPQSLVQQPFPCGGI